MKMIKVTRSFIGKIRCFVHKLATYLYHHFSYKYYDNPLLNSNCNLIKAYHFINDFRLTFDFRHWCQYSIYYHIADDEGHVEDESSVGYAFTFKWSSVAELTKTAEETCMEDAVVCTRSPLNGKLCPLHFGYPLVLASRREYYYTILFSWLFLQLLLILIICFKLS